MAYRPRWRWRLPRLATAMATDPALVYAGPESRSIDVLAILYNGTAATVRGVLRHFDTSAGEAGQPFADAGPVLWIAFAGDAEQIEFVEFTERATGRLLHHRVTKRERVSANYDTVKLNLSALSVVIAQRGDFNPLQFSPRDFAT